MVAILVTLATLLMVAIFVMGYSTGEEMMMSSVVPLVR